jgi:hypothetical protein
MQLCYRFVGARTRGIVVGLGCLFALSAITADGSAAHDGAEVKVTPILWRDPGPMATRDLYWGPGDQTRAPAPPFTFVEEDLTGTKPKLLVTDAKGISWAVKFANNDSVGNEVHAEIASGRLLWAVGYLVEEQYYVADGRFDGIRTLRRASEVVGPDGGFRSARFERRPSDVERRGHWEFAKNPFVGSKELSGLHTLVMLLGNWDLRSANTGVLRVPIDTGDAGDAEDRYILSDTGTAFGRMADGLVRQSTRWNLEHYQDQTFIARAITGTLEFRYPIAAIPERGVPLAHARWISRLLSQLSPAQVRQAFSASGATDGEIEGFSTAVLARIEQLRDAVGED